MLKAANLEKLYNSGKFLEIFSSSYYQTLNYYVETNLKWIEDSTDGKTKIDVFELDIYGKIFRNGDMFTILSECKRGCNFNDLLLFSGTAQIVKANKNILICETHLLNDIKNKGEELGIDAISPQEISNNIIANSAYDIFMMFYRSNLICNSLFDKKTLKDVMALGYEFNSNENQAYNLLRKHLAVLIGEIWKTNDLLKKAKLIKDFIDIKDFVRKAARIINIKPGNKKAEYYMQEHSICQAAGYLMLKYRVAYIVCAVECAIQKTNGKSIQLTDSDDILFYQLVQELCKNIDLASKIPCFLQTYIYIFGGVMSVIDNDIENISKFLKISVDDIKKIIEWLKKLFLICEGKIQWGFSEEMGVLILDYTPHPLRGLGMINRKSLNYSIDNFLYAKEWILETNKYIKGEEI